MKKRSEPQRLVLVQAIVINWLKDSRGAPGTVARNRVPEALALPATPPDVPGADRKQRPERPRIEWARGEPVPGEADEQRQPDLFVQVLSFGGSNAFREPITQRWAALTTRLPLETILSVGSEVVPVRFASGGAPDEQLDIHFSWLRLQGQPRRGYRSANEHATLTLGQSLRIRYNARDSYTYEGGWHYKKHVLNIAFTDALASDLFLTRPPDHLISDMADLF